VYSIIRERYRDLIGAADSISEMMSCSKQVCYVVLHFK